MIRVSQQVLNYESTAVGSEVKTFHRNLISDPPCYEAVAFFNWFESPLSVVSLRIEQTFWVYFNMSSAVRQNGSDPAAFFQFLFVEAFVYLLGDRFSHSSTNRSWHRIQINPMDQSSNDRLITTS